MKTLIFILLSCCFFTFGQDKSPPNVSLHFAALQGNLEAVKQHIEAGSDLNQKDQFGSTPLIIAVTFGKNDVAKLLIDAGADLLIGNNEDSTPLHIAALLCRTEIVKALLEKGANKYLRNINGSTAYDIVASPIKKFIEIYNNLEKGLKPFGFKLDLNRIKNTRPIIAELLKPHPEELKAVDYTPLLRDDWQNSTPSKEGLNPMLVSELYLDAANLKTIYSLLVIKNGNLIAEKYFNEGSIDQLSKRASVTKSYISAFMGIAFEKGYLNSIDQKMIEFFPDIADKITDVRKKQITIKNMLQMRAGYPWEETNTTYWNAIWSGEYISKIVDVPLTKDPDTEFQYSNLTSNWLGIIISRACGTDLKSFGEKNLFNPLNVKLGGWLKDLDGYYIGSGDIQFTSRDMAKFGLLYLNKGEYQGKQLVPSDWVRESLRSYSKDINSAGIESGEVGHYFHDIGYGYQWWSATAGIHNFNLAWGHGGQFIILLHDLNIVIVTTADPFWGKQEHFDAWRYEKSIVNTLGKFIKSLPED